MNLMKCENGHFYDGDKFDSCPHCLTQGDTKPKNNTVEEPTPKMKEENVKPKKHFFDFGKPHQNADERPTEIIHEEDNTKTLLLSQEENEAIQINVIQSEFKEPHSGTLSNMNPTEYARSQADEYVSLRSAVAMVKETSVPSDEGKTVGYFGNGGNEPMVGWLVCIGGPHLGEGYSIKTGRNSIGRSAVMDVIIVKDNKVSRDKHAIVMYEPVGREYMVLPGESSGLTYKNGKVVLTPEKLEARDVIQIGDTKLMLIPLCGPDFSWEDYTNEGV